MSKSTFTNKLKLAAAQSFIDSFRSNSNYLFISHFATWDSVPTPNNWVLDETTAWRDMGAAKRIDGNSLSLVVPRINWEPDTPYSQYGDRTNQNSIFHYVLSNNHVFVCLSNGNGGNTGVITGDSQTTNNPGERNLLGDNAPFGVINTQDGYLWRYLYTITDLGDNDFLTDEWMPVNSEATNQIPPVPGTIDRIDIINAGSGYNGGETSVDADDFVVTIVGDGTGAVATANIVNGSVANVTMVNYGTGYSNAVITIGTLSEPYITKAQTVAVLSPALGHGANPAADLGANNVFLAMRVGRLDSSEANTFGLTGITSGTSQFKFGQWGILRDPYKYGTDEVANTDSCVQTTNLVVEQSSSSAPAYSSGATVYQVDETNTMVFEGVVYDFLDLSSPGSYGERIVRVTSIMGTPRTGTNLLGADSEDKVGSVTEIRNPTFEPYSGSILYLENVDMTQRNDGQAELYRLVFTF